MRQVTSKMVEHALIGVLSRPFIDRTTTTLNSQIREQRAITKEFKGNPTPAYIYNYYITICHKPTWDLTDDAKVAKQLGMSTRKVADTRRSLTKSGWINFVVSSTGKFRQAFWFIGKDVVAMSGKLLTGMEVTDKDLLDNGLVTSEEYNKLKSL